MSSILHSQNFNNLVAKARQERDRLRVRRANFFGHKLYHRCSLSIEMIQATMIIEGRTYQINVDSETFTKPSSEHFEVEVCEEDGLKTNEIMQFRWKELRLIKADRPTRTLTFWTSVDSRRTRMQLIFHNEKDAKEFLATGIYRGKFDLEQDAEQTPEIKPKSPIAYTLTNVRRNSLKKLPGFTRYESLNNNPDGIDDEVEPKPRSSTRKVPIWLDPSSNTHYLLGFDKLVKTRSQSFWPNSNQ